MKQYGPEKDGDGVAKTEEYGMKGQSLHGKSTLENKRARSGNKANEVDLDENMGLDVRKAKVLDYLEGGGDGRGDDVESRLGEFKRENPGWVDHKEVDELYPKG